MRCKALAWAVLAPVWYASAQAPRVNAVVNAASYVTATAADGAVAPGSIATIFGTNLAESAASASASPPPFALNGTRVLVDGVPAALFYVSPSQINFLLPDTIGAGDYNGWVQLRFGQALLSVGTAAGESNTVVLNVARHAAGIFTRSGGGCGPAAVLNVAADGSTSLNSPANPAASGSAISVFLTGLGIEQDGSDREFSLPSWFDAPFSHLSPSYVGPAPGLPGVDQVNLALPASIRPGCAVPFRIGNSHYVTVSIGEPGKPCVEPSPGSEGLVTLTRTTVANDPAAPVADTLEAVFSSAPGRVEATTMPNYNRQVILLPKQDTAACPPSGYRYLDAGVLGLKSAGRPNISVLSSGGVYLALLPGGFFDSRDWTLTGTEGREVGAFETPAFRAGAPIHVTSSFPKGSTMDWSSPDFGGIKVQWTGGQPDEIVNLRIVFHYFLYDVTAQATVPATDGVIVFPETCMAGHAASISCVAYTPVAGFRSFDMTVIHSPAQAVLTHFIAPGLTLGGQLTWQYVYRFADLR